MQEKQTNQPGNKKIWLNLLLVVAILAIMLTVVGSLEDFDQIFHVIGTIDLGFFMIALGISLIALLIMALSHQIVLRALDKRLPYATGFLIQLTEPFFNGITPFSSGAQPVQLYYYHKHGMEGNQATSILVVNMILFQIASIILTILCLSFFWNYIYSAPGYVLIYIMVGSILNILILILFFLLAYVKRAYRLFEKFFSFFERFKLTKKIASKLKNKTSDFVVNFQGSVHFLFTKKRVFLLATTAKMVSLILYYTTTLVIAISLGLQLSGIEPVYLIAASLLAIVTMQFVPLPGASGGTEFVFSALLFGLLAISQQEVFALMLLWRFATYYLGMIFGFINYLILMKRKVRVKA